MDDGSTAISESAMVIHYSDAPLGEIAPASGRRFYTWTFPGAPVKVRLALDVVDDIQTADVVENSFKICGGLLQGKVRDGAIFIDSYRPLEDLNAASVQEAIRAPLRGSRFLSC